jgi:methionyl aminopeptidase
MKPSEQALYEKAGRICAQARAFGVSLITIGAENLAVSRAIDEKIRELGGTPAFPTQISCNHIAAHFCPNPDDHTTFAEGDVCKLDLGVHVDGYIADTAITVDLSADGRHAKLIAASKEACDEAIKRAVPGTELRTIGKVIADTIRAYGFQPITNLGGHGLTRYGLHEHPSIPNYDNGDDTVLEEGLVIAIEPFATDGVGSVREAQAGNIYSFLGKKPVRSPYARAVQDELARFEGLPFTTHQLKTPHKQAEIGIAELLRAGALEAHPPLIESQKGLVSQHEHSLIVGKTPLVFTK